MIKLSTTGSFKKTFKFLKQASHVDPVGILNGYGQEGVDALAAATPVDTGLTSVSWSYRVEHTPKGYRLVWTNSNVVNGVCIAIILQYGHGTRNGGYVEGRDYINPAIQPIFDRIARDSWKEVS
jgi:hypothetical protein